MSEKQIQLDSLKAPVSAVEPSERPGSVPPDIRDRRPTLGVFGKHKTEKRED